MTLHLVILKPFFAINIKHKSKNAINKQFFAVEMLKY